MRRRFHLDPTEIPLVACPASAAAPLPVRDCGFAVEAGDRVTHPRFGKGAVVEVIPFAGMNDGGASVLFDRAGVRRVPLDRLDRAA